MKKISKFIKKNIKVIIAFYLGFILAGTSVYAANTIYSKNVTYDNSNSGLEATNVQDALDETYTKCFPPVLVTNKIIDLYNAGPSFEKNSLGYYNVAQSILLDNHGDYRYSGVNANNYVKFNNELWRIIGSFHDVDDGTGKIETRIKIIRNESIGSYAFDNRNISEWDTAQLQEMLNTLYYNRTSGNCYSNETCDFTGIGLNSTARSMIDNAKYYTGKSPRCGGSGYNSERSGGYWVGKIGLIYPSDYNYAENTYDLNQSWTMIADMERYGDQEEDYNGVNWIDSSGNVDDNCDGNGYPSAKRNIFPVAYLKVEVIINGGTGTESDPYTLKL